MMRRLFAFSMLCALLGSPAQGGRAAQADDGEAGSVWTVIIPDAFPHYIYTWHMKGDGSYREDGRDAAMGRPIQPTLSGRWSREGPRMLMRQDDQPYVFDGVVLGNLYAGTLYFGGSARSRFCAARGEKAPERCDAAPSVAEARPDWEAFTSLCQISTARASTDLRAWNFTAPQDLRQKMNTLSPRRLCGPDKKFDEAADSENQRAVTALHIWRQAVARMGEGSRVSNGTRFHSARPISWPIARISDAPRGAFDCANAVARGPYTTSFSVFSAPVP